MCQIPGDSDAAAEQQTNSIAMSAPRIYSSEQPSRHGSDGVSVEVRENLSLRLHPDLTRFAEYGRKGTAAQDQVPGSSSQGAALRARMQQQDVQARIDGEAPREEEAKDISLRKLTDIERVVAPIVLKLHRADRDKLLKAMAEGSLVRWHSTQELDDYLSLFEVRLHLQSAV